MYNKTFRLDLDDIDLIERAIDFRINSLNICNDESAEKEIKDLHNLKGLIYNQKIWYRPRNDTYISG